MGSVSSKAARKLPKEKPSWTSSPVQATTEQAHPPLRTERPLAFENKNEGEHHFVHYPPNGVEYAFGSNRERRQGPTLYGKTGSTGPGAS